MSFRQTVKKWVVRTLLSYDGEALLRTVRRAGLKPGDTLMVHSSWLAMNGFRGKPADMVAALKRAVGPDGLLVMTSMPYHNMSSEQWLARGKALDLKRSPSMMGMLSEVFRRSEGVLRSASPTHPLLAWGRDAQGFIQGHELTPFAFGPASPFAKLLYRDALILCVDAPFSSITFTHFVEDRLAHTLAVPLYSPVLHSGSVIDPDGERHARDVRVLSSEANALRRDAVLEDWLVEQGVLRRLRVGNTRLLALRAAGMTAATERLVASGRHFFDVKP
ncbi:AAC(3) family N-acetyltransferase [Methyloversatilis sp.]|uniref:AAC(3) family N-acetyltransferase n=1 Tax=Methyloversatilis sp. TaxID=2569862 RepID=UPI003F717822